VQPPSVDAAWSASGRRGLSIRFSGQHSPPVAEQYRYPHMT
jgi:hypothetical protein